MSGKILAIDQGTTSSRAILFDENMRIAGVGQQEFRQIYPASGWVEHDPEDIWQTVLRSCHMAMEAAGIAPREIAALGIANQRETVLLWNRLTGEPVHNAIVWQDRRTSATCERMKRNGLEALYRKRTGLLLDPYFSGTKLSWLLDRVRGARKLAERGELLFGTVDSFLVWRLTGGKVHATDATNASRTLMYDIRENRWDPELLEPLRIPLGILPEVRESADDYGIADKAFLGAPIPILGIAGDQQAAAIGQACFAPGMLKATYGTGCFALLNTGENLVTSKNRLISTIAYRLDGKTTYALEGSIFVAGAAVQWLRDSMGMIGTAADSSLLAAAADPGQDVYLVPAFVGLGAPWWDAEARGALFGLTRNTGPAELARAALESVAFQTADLLEAMRGDIKGVEGVTVLRVDGGMVASDWTMQRLADILDAPVDRPSILETTALGAAWLAGFRAGEWPGADAFSGSWTMERRFVPLMDAASRKARLRGWKEAVLRTLSPSSRSGIRQGHVRKTRRRPRPPRQSRQES